MGVWEGIESQEKVWGKGDRPEGRRGRAGTDCRELEKQQEVVLGWRRVWEPRGRLRKQ